ncbi:CorA family divalent cation transporter [Leucobacter musarum]|uniref:CorA family divalent cation transporter n=1 Tax=Leucobacter musarum TaxID=1930747 RepID=UPI0009EACC69|nr:CorA family divalent cation transporter [Leucobacter musarum]
MSTKTDFETTNELQAHWIQVSPEGRGRLDHLRRAHGLDPPTLIATFYGMNFTGMPELNTQHGFLVTTILTLVAAISPLWYIKRRGWLR